MTMDRMDKKTQMTEKKGGSLKGMAAMAGQHGKKGMGMPAPGEVESFSGRRAANGWSLEVRRKNKADTGGSKMDWDAGREERVFNDTEEMVGHLRKICGGGKK